VASAARWGGWAPWAFSTSSDTRGASSPAAVPASTCVIFSATQNEDVSARVFAVLDGVVQGFAPGFEGAEDRGRIARHPGCQLGAEGGRGVGDAGQLARRERSHEHRAETFRVEVANRDRGAFRQQGIITAVVAADARHRRGFHLDFAHRLRI